MTRFLLAFLLSAGAYASPTAHLNQVGKGEMRYLFWTIYEAEYYQGASQEYAMESEANGLNDMEKTGTEKALRILYRKSIDRAALVEATKSQWRHLGYSPEDIEIWLRPVEVLWPDVEPNNTLTFLLSKNGQSRFFYNNQLLGTISDTSFGDAFLSIWLSTETTEPELRAQLMGIKP
jgi:hypothetical protein